MKHFNHILNNSENTKSKYSSSYWALNLFTNNNILPKSNNLHRTFFNTMYSNTTVISRNINKTLSLRTSSTYSHYNQYNTFQDTSTNKLIIKNYELMYTKPEYKSNPVESRFIYKGNRSEINRLYHYLKFTPTNYSKWLITNLKNANIIKTNELNTTYDNLNIYFLRKERLYTKLKYSRTPAYDIVSGGSAALLAAFFGFLITEKVGFELLDSGDFYFAFMYIVFGCLILRSIASTGILSIEDNEKSAFTNLNPILILKHFTTILSMLISFIKSFLK